MVLKAMGSVHYGSIVRMQSLHVKLLKCKDLIPLCTAMVLQQVQMPKKPAP